ncbi:MAG: hypothetical protein LBN38_02305 [Verrucomicrobiota bacterium]|nr:hypothetical protein [Verrucomicrobiota bacterium]
MAFWKPLRAIFDLNVTERRFLLGVLLLFFLGLTARYLHQRHARLQAYPPPPEHLFP